jgi:asparagine synthase (glutamine-hydrolysing)
MEGLARHLFWVSNIQPQIQQQLGLTPLETERGEETGELLDRVQQWDLEKSLAEGLLTKADRSSMSATLELRAPFLDSAMLELAASIPIEYRVRGLQTKILLKRYALKYLPSRIVHRRKRGLSVPLNQWLRAPLREWAASALGGGRLELVGVCPRAALDLLMQHCEGGADHARPLWTLLVLNEWLEWAAKKTAPNMKSSAISTRISPSGRCLEAIPASG